MKNINPLFILVFIISLTFSGEEEKYTFIYNNGKEFDVGTKSTFLSTNEMSFTIPEIGLVKYSDQYIDETEYLGIDGEFWKFKATLSDIESDNFVSGIEILDQYKMAMEDTPCYLYVKSRGFEDEVHHIEPVKEENYYLQEAFEAAYMNIIPRGFRYAFGDGTGRAVGEILSFSYDSAKIYVNMGSPPSLVSAKGTWMIKRVKKRGGRKIAIVEAEELLTFDLRIAVNFLGERRLISGYATGIANATYKWDLDSGEMLKGHGVTNLSGNFEMDDKTFHMKVFMRNIGKKVN